MLIVVLRNAAKQCETMRRTILWRWKVSLHSLRRHPRRRFAGGGASAIQPATKHTWMLALFRCDAQNYTHNLKVVASNPTPATKRREVKDLAAFRFLRLCLEPVSGS